MEAYQCRFKRERENVKWKKKVQEMFSKFSFKLMTDKWDIVEVKGIISFTSFLGIHV